MKICINYTLLMPTLELLSSKALKLMRLKAKSIIMRHHPNRLLPLARMISISNYNIRWKRGRIGSFSYLTYQTITKIFSILPLFRMMKMKSLVFNKIKYIYVIILNFKVSYNYFVLWMIFWWYI